MKKFTYTCDGCKKPIDDVTHPLNNPQYSCVGDTNLYVLDYHGDGGTILGHNKLPMHLHGYCFRLGIQALLKSFEQILERPKP